MAEPSPAEHREKSLDLLDRGSRLPATSPQRVGLLLESLTHATLALSAPLPPGRLEVVQLSDVLAGHVPAPEPAEAPAAEPTPSAKAPRRRRTPSTPTPEKDTAAA